MKIAPHILSILAAMSVSGSTATLQGNLSRQDYVQTNEILSTLGFSWIRKEKLHRCQGDAQSALATVLESGTPEIHTAREKKKDFQAFFTPASLADELVAMAEYHFPYGAPKRILEPSAGNGQLAKAIQRKWKDAKVDVCEIQEQYHQELKDLGCNVVGSDFLTYQATKSYDLVILNPPFAKHADQSHVRHAYELLSPAGILIAVTSQHWRSASHKVDVAFRQFVEEKEADIYEVPADTFKESGTRIACNFLVIQK